MLYNLYFHILIIIIPLNFFLFSDEINNEKSDSLVKKDTLNDSLTYIDVTFSQLLSESKLLFADAVLADMNHDTLNALYYFDNLFESLAQLQKMNSDAPSFVKRKYEDYYSLVIEYYENKAVSIDYSQTQFSTAVLKDKINEYFYIESMDDLDDIDIPLDPFEVIDGGIPIVMNSEVRKMINILKGPYKKSMQRWLNREDKFKEIVLPILDEKNLPLELFYVAMAESGLNATAKSYAAAVGPWQFIESTARIYFSNDQKKFRKDWFIDERRDIIKSTNAAADYLGSLYREFGDWYLAFAAYNGGEGRLREHIKYGRQLGYGNPPYEFWDMVPNPSHKGSGLPKETRLYVPKILAMIFISKNPEKYGFTKNPEKNFEWKIIDIDKTVTIEDIAKCSKLDVKLLRDYNPELLTSNPTYVDVNKNDVYKFKMPVSCSSDFDSLFSLIEPKDADRVVFIKHKVKRGESLWLIAKKYNSTITSICELNKITRNKPLKMGKVLTVAKDIYGKNKKSFKQPKKITHIVRRGDTLSEIAEKYKVNVKSIKKWNGLKNNNIRIGWKLTIYK